MAAEVLTIQEAIDIYDLTDSVDTTLPNWGDNNEGNPFRGLLVGANPGPGIVGGIAQWAVPPYGADAAAIAVNRTLRNKFRLQILSRKGVGGLAGPLWKREAYAALKHSFGDLGNRLEDRLIDRNVDGTNWAVIDSPKKQEMNDAFDALGIETKLVNDNKKAIAILDARASYLAHADQKQKMGDNIFKKGVELWAKIVDSSDAKFDQRYKHTPVHERKDLWTTFVADYARQEYMIVNKVYPEFDFVTKKVEGAQPHQ